MPQEQGYWRYVEEKAVSLCQRYSYQRIDTPIMEAYDLFIRTVGEETDIVQKEMYLLEDRGGGGRITLRPEATAAVCRAYLEHGMHNLPQPVRLYSLSAPMFRYSRPQAGRLRQFHQLNVEAIGDADAAVDAEVIELAWRFFQELGVTGLSLQFNSIGDGRCRPEHLRRLKEYYSRHRSRLCPDCKGRLERNVLRLLDCKNESCQALAEEAPRSTDYLCDECQDHFLSLRRYLDIMELPAQANPKLVRGLDYYTRTVFEVQSPQEGAQSALGGGGRYDGLIQELGGKPTPGVGFAVGIERVIRYLKSLEIPSAEAPRPTAFVAYVTEDAKDEAVRLTSQLRGASINAVLATGGRSLKAQLKQADSIGAPYTLILGDEEVRSGTVVLRDMAQSTQESIPRDQVVERLS